MGNRRNSFGAQFTNINDIYIKFGGFIVNYLQNKSISAMENNGDLALIKESDACWWSVQR